jgi:ATP-binding cassette subfamily B protein
MRFPFSRQFDSKDCGPTCLHMITRFYGKKYSLQTLREKCSINREGVSLLGISDAAESIGFRTLFATIPVKNLIENAPLPLIAHWKQNHFVVVYKVKANKIYLADPAHGLVTVDLETFKKHWLSTKNNDIDTGVVLFLEPTPQFYQIPGEDVSKNSLRYFFLYLKPYKNLFVQLYIGLLLSSILSLIFPYLSQSLIDVGINQQNLSFINLVLVSQLLLQVSSLLVGFIRGWIFLHMGSRISISIISDFLIKLLKLPFTFFDNKTIGDILQRMSDHGRIQSFLTSSALTVIFSIANFFIFGFILLSYHYVIFLIYMIGTFFYFGWSLLFLGQRKALDYLNFNQASLNQNALLQLLHGVQEIKLQNCEKRKRWEWENVQAQQFQISIKSLTLSQYQSAGAFFIDQTKNIFISYYAARSVLAGELTLGMMLSISYIIGQLNGPIGNALGMILSYQDAKISLERLSEIHLKKDEEDDDMEKLDFLPTPGDIELKNVTFKYSGPHSEAVLKNITLNIPLGKKTAIVGTSGSGKTTLVKLLQKIYEPTSGEIFLSGIDLKNISGRMWRDMCGSVSQEGYLFSDTIANNIAVSDDFLNKEKLIRAVHIANIKDFVDSLPLRYNTKIGQDGNGISQGQKQRIHIARAIYKNPEYVFLDEATNSLDSHNEKVIVENLEEFFFGKTVVIIAHRLSTVKNADQIVVLKDGEIIEIGSHKELIGRKGAYHELVKDQLELGN